jgi:signal transduction histidine kinase
MSSKNDKPVMHSAAWRISLWATVAFACGTLLVFVFIEQFVANDIQRRSDAWLSGEVEVLGDVAERTPNDALYGRVVSEVAELASREVPNRQPSETPSNDTVFFLQTGRDGSLKLWVGAGDGQATLKVIQSSRSLSDRPTDIRVQGLQVPYRVASTTIDDGTHIYLGLSERDERRVLRKLLSQFFLMWLSLVLLGFAIVFYTTRRTLKHVREISEAASRIGHSDLTARVPTSNRHDEMAQLALTLNRMLDRIEISMHQLHTITDSLAHDLRSPLTAIRGKLETSLSDLRDSERTEPIVAAIDELDRLTDFLNKSLDVAEAKASALRLTPSGLDLDELLRAMIDLYEPSMSERGLKVRLQSEGPLKILADAGLIHRMIANLFDNELKHLSPGCTVTVQLHSANEDAVLVFRDDGKGFDQEIQSDLLERRVKGKESSGHGLGLAFVDAVVRTHGGTVDAANGASGGAVISIMLPIAFKGPRISSGSGVAAAPSQV